MITLARGAAHENTRPAHAGHPLDAGCGFPSVGPLCAAALTDLPVAGVAVVLQGENDGREVLHVTDAVIARLDEWQFTLRQGPSIDSYLVRRVVLVPDLQALTARRRWPEFTRETADSAARAMFVFPLQAAGTPIGNVQFYADRCGPLNPADLAACVLVAETIMAAVLCDFTTTTAATGPGRDAQDSPFGWSPVAMATGMISVQLDNSVPHALSRLRAKAREQHRLISDVADDVLTYRLTFTDAPD